MAKCATCRKRKATLKLKSVVICQPCYDSLDATRKDFGWKATPLKGANRDVPTSD